MKIAAAKVNSTEVRINAQAPIVGVAGCWMSTALLQAGPVVQSWPWVQPFTQMVQRPPIVHQPWPPFEVQAGPDEQTGPLVQAWTAPVHQGPRVHESMSRVQEWLTVQTSPMVQARSPRVQCVPAVQALGPRVQGVPCVHAGPSVHASRPKVQLWLSVQFVQFVHTPNVHLAPAVQAAGPAVQLAPSVHQGPVVQVGPDEHSGPLVHHSPFVHSEPCVHIWLPVHRSPEVHAGSCVQMPKVHCVPIVQSARSVQVEPMVNSPDATPCLLSSAAGRSPTFHTRSAMPLADRSEM